MSTITASRRWQGYAARTVFLLLLLVGLWVCWQVAQTPTWIGVGSGTSGRIIYVQRSGLEQYAVVGQGFYFVLSSFLISLILFAAPALTAGTICVERARGTLLHLMVTDLSDAEIVFGKLGSRLATLLTLVASAIPVAAIGSLLGGVSSDALVALAIATIGTALFACSLTMLVSLVNRKVHEVLISTYLLEMLWIRLGPFWRQLHYSFPVIPLPPVWLLKLNPYSLAIGPSLWGSALDWRDFAIFTAVTWGASALFVLLTLVYLRKLTIDPVAASRRKAESVLKVWLRRIGERLRPDLDRSPVAWRKWHRHRPSPMLRTIWTSLGMITMVPACVGLIVFLLPVNGRVDKGSALISWGMWGQLTLGLMLLAAIAPTSLAEERVRGDLDVLLCTPLSTGEIVAGKWWGVFSISMRLAWLPLIAVIGHAMLQVGPDEIRNSRNVPINLYSMSMFDRRTAVLTCLSQCLATGALIASIGMITAINCKRVGVAAWTCIVLCMALGAGLESPQGLAFLDFLFSLLRPLGIQASISNPLRSVGLYGAWDTLSTLTDVPERTRLETWSWIWVGAGVKALFALVLFAVSVYTFDRRLGRATGRQRAPRPQSIRLVPNALPGYSGR